MLRLFKQFFNQPKPAPPSVPPEAGTPEFNETFRLTEIGLAVDLDRIPLEVQDLMSKELMAKNRLPLFRGQVEHAYSSSAVQGTATCPRCHGPTQQQHANFIYATDVAPRVMLAPAGHFCARCPTVIIDEQMIIAGMKPGLRFKGVMGIELGDKAAPAPGLFRTWNGQKSVYILDENEQFLGLGSVAPSLRQTGPLTSAAFRKKLKRKRQLAKRARQRNRRR